MQFSDRFLHELQRKLRFASLLAGTIAWDMKKSRSSQGVYWACCPFHSEKTPSFKFDESKGLYHCFGCHEGGNAIQLYQKLNGYSFQEAVRNLAREAGMPLPRPKAPDSRQERVVPALLDIVEQADRFYRRKLVSGEGREALAYLGRRGVDQAAIREFGLGLAPDGRDLLFRHLLHRGFEEKRIIEAGLARRPEDGREPYDVFRNRILYPISDLRDRTIAFGGRAMDSRTKAKYLNSPESDIFHKRKRLYNHARAIRAARRRHQVIVVEGYMDVIALSMAGFEASVAMLGTALSETQLLMLWKMNEEPVVAVDGDEAGMRSANRIAELALPMIESSRTLRFCLFPGGQDPDDFLADNGAEGMRKLVDKAIPLHLMIWRSKTHGIALSTPERRARLEQRLGEAASRIADLPVRRQYARAFKDLTWNRFRNDSRRSPNAGLASGSGQAPTLQTRSSLLSSRSERQAPRHHVLENRILAVCVSHPAVIKEFSEQLEEIEFSTEASSELLYCMLKASAGQSDPGSLRETIEEAVGKDRIRSLLSNAFVTILPSVRESCDIELVRRSLAQMIDEFGAEIGVIKGTTDIRKSLADSSGQVDRGEMSEPEGLPILREAIDRQREVRRSQLG